MKWSEGAEQTLKKVPFFVRKKVRGMVEDRVQSQGRSRVEVDDLTAARKDFVSGMASQVKGFQADACFAGSGCPNRAVSSEKLMESVEKLLNEADLLSFLKQMVGKDLKYHHEFRVSAADCPNGCSQPQIKDVGILGAVVPGLGEDGCTLCGECEAVCPDKAIVLDQEAQGPVIDEDACMMCGKCIATCPTGYIREAKQGFRVMLGGRLGRHPRLAMELPGIWSEKEVLDILKAAIDFYKTSPKSRGGKRFSQILTAGDLETIMPSRSLSLPGD